MGTDVGYIASDGTLTDGDAWVPIVNSTITSTVSAIEYNRGYNDESQGTYDGETVWNQYLDLVLILYMQEAVTSQDHGEISLKINDDSNNANYEHHQLIGSNSGLAASNRTDTRILMDAPSANAGSGNFYGAAIIHFTDINSMKYKNMIIQNATDIDGSGNGKCVIRTITWKNTDRIRILRLGGTEGGFSAGSRISLFGILPRMVN